MLSLVFFEISQVSVYKIRITLSLLMFYTCQNMYVRHATKLYSFSFFNKYFFVNFVKKYHICKKFIADNGD